MYTGITNNLERRFKEHKDKIGGHYTASHKVEKVIYTKKYETKSEALKREAQIKGWKRNKKLALVNFNKKAKPVLSEVEGLKVGGEKRK